MKNRKILLLGFGDVNQRLTRLLLNQNTDLYAAKRSAFPNKVKDLEKDIQFNQADITNPKHMAELLSIHPDQVVITIAPSEYSEQGYRRSYLKAVETLLKTSSELQIQPEVIFISSSSVYGQNKGELVNEQSECTPLRHNGKILLEAESLLSASALKTTVIRFSGIYGQGRHRLISLCLKQELNSQKDQIHWTNRINSEDCARVISHLLSLPTDQRDSLYLASDNHAVERHRVYNWIRSQFQLDKLTDPNPTNPSTKVTGKRCDNSRLRHSGFEFKYPSYQEGFIPILNEYKEGIEQK